jgi:formate C-acetyltransferase
MKKLNIELKEYYSTITVPVESKDWGPLEKSRQIWAKMEEYTRKHKETNTCILKSVLHDTIADEFEPVIFPHSPFFFEMGLKPARNWGTPNHQNAGSWMFYKFLDLFESHKKAKLLRKRTELKIDANSPFVDSDHHSIGYGRVLKKGISGLIDEALDARKKCASENEFSFIDAAIRSMKSSIKIAHKFAAKAEAMQNGAPDALSKRFLSMIAKAARKVPEFQPETFYEGLAAMWFLRETTGALEGVGISIIGHPDRLLIDLYRNDIKAGRIKEKEALDLVARWLAPTDIKFDLENNTWPETSTTLTLGGCDENGAPVYNEVTKLFLKAHYENKLLNPKLNCRFGKDTPVEFLEEISRQILAGHNVFALINDDCLIEANVRMGKNVEDCRLYGAGGCQETVVEGVEHSAGAYYYFNIPKAYELSMMPTEDIKTNLKKLNVKESWNEMPENFEDYYQQTFDFIASLIINGAQIRREIGKAWPGVNPCPFFSSTLYDCFKNKKDYTAGGARYNPGGISLVGFGTVVDSIFAVKKASFDDGWLSLKELKNILKNNWDGNENLRRRFVSLPKYGHNNAEVDALAARFAEDLRKVCVSQKNERDGYFQPSFFVYYSFVTLADQTAATPDGRKYGEMYTQGISPGRLNPTKSLSEAILSAGKIDFAGFPGNAVLDVQLPMGGMDAKKLGAMTKVFGNLKNPTLQCSCANPEELKDAQINPEKHRDLMVRISGLSAKFVALKKSVQDEIINRSLMS